MTGERGARESRIVRVLGAVMLLVPFLPLRRLFGPLQGASALVPPAEWALGLALFGVVAWLAALATGGRLAHLGSPLDLLEAGSHRMWTASGVVVLGALLVAASREAFHHAPHLIDSVVQLFQAKIFASGSLAAPAPPRGGFFATQHMITDAATWYSQYPPGHAALLAVGVAAGAGWIVPVILSLGTAVFLYAATRRMYGTRCARATLVLLVLCPFFWFMGASFMNHVSSLFFVSVFLYLFTRWEEAGRTAVAFAAGGVLGAAALSRPLTAVAVAIPFAVFAATSVRRSPAPAGDPTDDERRGGAASYGSDTDDRATGRDGWIRSLTPVAAAGLGFAVVASLYLLFNARVTGDPFLPGYVELWGESHGLGFHATPWGGEHTPLDGLRNELLDLSLLNLFLFEWPVPALLPVGAACALGWTVERWDRRLLVAFLAIPAAYYFYWHRDAFLGPRFLYSSLAFLVPLTARSILELAERLRGRTFQLGSLFRPIDTGHWAGLVLLLCVGYSVGYAIPQRFRVYATGMPSMKTDVRQEAVRSGIRQGLIFVKVSWGNRLIAGMRGRDVPAGLALRAYRNVGHCRLHHLVAESAASGSDAAELSARLERSIARGDSLVRAERLNGDPTLRLTAGGRVTEECREALRYDEGNYTNYAPHLVANAPDLSGRFVVARDLRDANGRLRSVFSNRRAFVWNGDRFRELSGEEGP